VSGLLLATNLAFAHARPIRFDPAPGAVLDAAPSEITGWFSSPIRRESTSFLRVIDANGQNVEQGDLILSDDRRQMSIALQPGLGEGKYLVHWSALDEEDGHPVSDCFVFYVGQAAADAGFADFTLLNGGGDCPAEPEEEPAPESGEGSSDGEGGIPAWALVAGVVAGLGVGAAGGRFFGR
jgi:copper transport protein